MSIDKYKIRKQANVPTRVKLFDPTTEKMTEDWVDIRSSLSDEFLKARDSIMQEVQSLTEPNKEKRKEKVAELQLGLKASLVAGWSFDLKASPENIIDFLREAPQVQMMIMSVADDSARFFSKPSGGSSTGQQKK